MIPMKKEDVTKWPTLISCGILKNEIKEILSKNDWPIQTRFLDSSLHINLDRLSHVLSKALSKDDTKKLVLYGTCHPKMDDILAGADAKKIPGQNCVEFLLGKERFTKELSKGAFFLFEDWAVRWEKISYEYFGNWEIMREIFQSCHKYILCIKTPCSGDYEESANKVSQCTGLPLVWEDFGLEQLEKVFVSNLHKATWEWG